MQLTLEVIAVSLVRCRVIGSSLVVALRLLLVAFHTATDEATAAA